MLRITGLDHVGLTVTDMDRSLDFYRRLGLEVLRTSGPDESGIRSAVIKVGAQELNVFSRPDLVAGDWPEDAVGVHHFCLRVEAGSAGELVDGVRRAGLEIVRGPTPRRDGVSLFLADPDGVRVELQIFH